MLSTLEKLVLRKIEYFCSGEYNFDKRFKFTKIVNETITPEEANEFHKQNLGLLWNEACSLLIVQKILGIETFDEQKYNEILDCTPETLYEKFKIGLKRFRLTQKMDKINEDF